MLDIPPELLDGTAEGAFVKIFDFLMRSGVRPEGDSKQGRKWENKELAGRVNIGDRTVRNWGTGKNIPVSLDPVERAFLGEIPADEKRDPRREALRMAFREAYGEARKREVAKVSRQPEPESEEASKPPLGVEGVAKEQFAPVALTPSIESNGALGQPRKFPFAPVVSGVFVAGEVLGLIGSRFLGARRRHWTEKAAGDRFAIYVAFLD